MSSEQTFKYTEARQRLADIEKQLQNTDNIDVDEMGKLVKEAAEIAPKLKDRIQTVERDLENILKDSTQQEE